ncbi:hypothetical protein CGZ98_15265 [Enemella evansiae]|uniref:hypothetical protein n=1 Tax=Enemella evansiae TaxID=2016499 RepID=UPI000B95EC75|nr:hypothetical protein [Enemella evansiae]OYO09123.1 hypothetical protein CGZ98_15265 [Enemella evansiae]
MTLTLVLALALQALTIYLLRRFLGRNWLTHPFALMLLAATVYHGFGELLMLTPGALAANPYRMMLTPDEVHRGALVISGGMLATTAGYLWAVRRRGLVTTDRSQEGAAMAPLDWRILVLCLIPLAAATYSGEGFTTAEVLDSRNQSSIQVLAMSLFVMLMTLTTFSVIWRFGSRSFVPVMAANVLLLAAAGQRLEIAVSAITVWAMLGFMRRLPRARDLIILVVIGAACAFAITSVRSAQGREIFNTDSGLESRVSAIVNAFGSTAADTVSGGDLITQTAVRLDSNEWAGHVVLALSQGTEPMGLTAVVRSMSQAVPSFLNPSKNSGDVTDRSSEAAQIWYYGMPDNDHLPGHFGLWLGLTGIALYFPVMGFFGYLYGRLERWIFARVSTARLLTLILLLIGSLFVERGIPSLIIMLRYAIPLGILGFVAQRLWPRLSNTPAVPSHRLTSSS